MESTAFALPILPGKTTHWKDFAVAARTYRREAFDTCHRDLGVHKEVWCLQHTPRGDVVVVYMEAQDLASAMRRFAASETPFVQWFKAQVAEIHGIDLSRPTEAMTAMVHLAWEANER